LTGEWETSTDEGGYMSSSDPAARVEVEFEGTGIGIIVPGVQHWDSWRITLDGVEYPPFDGESRPVRRCVTNRLAPGQHTITLARLLPWRKGSVAISAIEIR
jgi:hypothetical protein